LASGNGIIISGLINRLPVVSRNVYAPSPFPNPATIKNPHIKQTVAAADGVILGSQLISPKKIEFELKTERTALMAASDNGHFDVVKMLLDNGADVNAKDQNGRTALYFAKEKGHQNIIMLFEAEAK